MPRDPRACRSDIVESRDAITVAARDLDLPRYQGNRLVRASVEREPIIIGEAAAALARFTPEISGAIMRARRIVDIRNQLTLECAAVDEAIVWAVVEPDVPVPHSECATLFQRVSRAHDLG